MATAATMSSSPITQVSQVAPQAHLQPPLLTRLSLDLRGRRFSVDRETIMNLPESVLLCLFPNGLVLSRQSVALSGTDTGDNSEEEELYGVDVRSFHLLYFDTDSSTCSLVGWFDQFDPDCFSYVLSFFRNAQDTFYGTETSPGLLSFQQHLLSPNDGHPSSPNDYPGSGQNPLLSKQAIIVLREELEYFSIPPKDQTSPDGMTSAQKIGTDGNGMANAGLQELKRMCGNYLLEKKNIFTALQRNVNKENNIAEQHLIDMLCMRCVVVHLLFSGAI